MLISFSFYGYVIETTVTANLDDIDSWFRNIGRMYSGQRLIVGLDIEWRPNFTSGGTINKAATLQLCINTSCLIIQLVHLQGFIPDSLREFLRNPRCIFVGVGVHSDLAKLNADYGLSFRNAVDVSEMAMSSWPSKFDQNPGLKDLALEVLGFRMAKPQSVTLSDWEARWLSSEQIRYACIDAFASYMIGNRLINGV